MASEGRASRDPKDARATKRMTFSTAGELIDKVQLAAEKEGSNASRVVDRLLRIGFAVEETEAAQDRLSDRLQIVLQRLEAMPYGGRNTAFAVLSEQRLLAVALAGRPEALPIIQALDPSVFSTQAHARAWELLRSEVEPGAGAADAIARKIETTVFDVPARDYLNGLSSAGPRLEGQATITAFEVLDAYVYRSNIGNDMDSTPAANYRDSFQLLRTLGQYAPAPERKASIKTSSKKRASG